MRILSCILALISMLAGRTPAYAGMVHHGKEPDESVVAHLQASAIQNINAIHTTIRLLDLLEAEYDNGATNVGPEFWEREVIARCDSVTAYLNDAVQYIESVLPKKIRDPFWTDIYGCLRSIKNLSLSWESLYAIYNSDLQKIMTGAENYLYTYMIIFGLRLREMDGLVKRYCRLLDEGPENLNRLTKEENARKKIQERNDRATARREKRDEPRRITQKSLHRGEGKVSFMDIPLGTGYDRFVKELKAAGFSLKQERDENSALYGSCREGFLAGTFDGIPAVIRLRASSLTRSVFEIEMIFKGFIDSDEAAEETDRLISREKSRYRYVAADANQVIAQIMGDTPSQMGVEMFDILSGNGKQVVKEMCFMKSELRLHLFDEQPAMDMHNSFGSISFGVYELSLGQEHIVRARYFDRSVGEAAGKEAKQGRQR